MNIIFIMIPNLARLSFLLFAFVPQVSGLSGTLPRVHTQIEELVAPATVESDILTYVNEDRKLHGLAPLKISAVESAIATKHSRDMASGRVKFGHSGLNARAKAIRKALGNISSVGENVASGQMTAREVVDGWLNSPGHKRNIEGDFTLTGIGYAQDKKGDIYFTQIFSK